jgi:hypothetical protein
MRQLHTQRPLGAPGRLLLAPVAALTAIVSVALMAVAAVVVLALMLLPGMRRRVKLFRFGGGGGARAAGAHVPGADPAARASAAPPAGGPTAPEAEKPRSYAEIVEAWPLVLAASLLVPGLVHAKLLVPMDDSQANHLKAYGLTYWVLQRGEKCEWLLNYRGGSFLLPESEAVQREANIRGVTLQAVSGSEEAMIRATIADENMETVNLEKAPRVAVYIPPNNPPWDDAVSMALQYADIPYEKVWDEEVLKGDLAKYDWLHLHHEDFTGQHGKFWASYHQFPWYQEEERVQKAMAARLGFAKVSQLKGAVAMAIKEYIGRGGFMFGMCSATDTYDIALASHGLDIADVIYDGDPPEPGASRKLDYSRTLAFRDFRIEMDPILYRFSDIDMTQDAAQRGPNQLFTLFDFSAKNDPVPSMLVQDHVNGVPEFLGQNTGFRRSRLKPGVIVLAEVEGTEEVKYLHGRFGQGTFTWLGGHDPEDYQHMVGDPATKLEQYPHSPGYRLILNNVLFPAAEKKKQRT